MTSHLSTRWAVAIGATGLVGGLALGATGLASAVSPSPNPAAPKTDTVPGPGHRHHGFRVEGVHLGAHGMVTAVSATSISLRTPDGTKSFGLNDQTKYFAARTKSTHDAVKVGDIVRVLVAHPRASTPVASVVAVVPARIHGWVTAIDGSTITLKDGDGFTRTVTTSSATKVSKDGAASTLAAVTVGDFLRASGPVAADGTTLNATHIGIGLPTVTRKWLGPGRAGAPANGPAADDQGMPPPPGPEDAAFDDVPEA